MIDLLAPLQAAPTAAPSVSALAAQWGINGAILAALAWAVVSLRKMYETAIADRDARIEKLEKRDELRMEATAKIQDALEEAVAVAGKQNEATMRLIQVQEQALSRIVERLDRLDETAATRRGARA